MPTSLKPKPVPIAKLEPSEWLRSTESKRTAAFATLIQICRDTSFEPIDASTWPLVICLAREHRLLSLLADRLRRTAPPEIATDLHVQTMAVTQRNLLFIAETLRVAKALTSAGITAAVFKGCLLAQLAYGASHLRQVLDLDFVVLPSDRARAIEVLAACGYHLDESWTPAIQEGHFRYDCECALVNTKLMTCVDLHWEFTPRNYGLTVGIDTFFEDLRPVSFHGIEVLTFSSNDQLLALCLHGAKHYWQKIEWLYTIATLIRRDPDLNLAVVLQRVENMGLRHILASGLILAEELFDVPLPADISAKVRSNRTAWRLAEISMQWVARAPEGPSPFEIRRFHALSRVTWIGRLRYWVAVLATPTEKDFSRPLPQTLFPLYVLLRFYRLIQEVVHSPKVLPETEARTTV